MSETGKHLKAMSLEQLAEGTLSGDEAMQARSHLAVCEMCSRELESYRSMFSLLEQLPRLAPSPAFADMVMARVHLSPRESHIGAWLRRLIPTTRRGWILVGTAIAAPVTPFIVLVTWLLFSPLVTPAAVAQWALLRAQSVSQASLAWLSQQATSVSAWDWIVDIYSTLGAVPAEALAGATALICIAIPLSAWGLVKLLRTPGESVTYAN